MVTAVIAIHIVICIALIIVILLQQGKGAEIGAVFGGSSQTVFGASGAGNMLTKTTWAMAAVFFATSIFLAYASTRRFTGSIFGSGRMAHRMSAPAGPVAPPPAKPAPMTAPVMPPSSENQPKPASRPVAPKPRM